MRIRTGRHIWQAVIAISLISLFIFCSNAGAENRSISNASRKTLGSQRDFQDYESFADSFFSKNMKKEHIPGAAVAIVKDGEVVFKKGYGYQNLEKKIPVDPDKTVFYICSTGKLFTGTAILQLYDKKQIKLNEDVQKYLNNFKIKNHYSKPVTFENLLTHTSGIDEGSFIGGGARTKSESLSYDEFMKLKNTGVLKEPGQSTRYSNFGYDVLGLLVQRITGMSYKEYVSKNILDRLGMNRSSVGMPTKNMAMPYLYVDGKMKPSKVKVYFPELGEGSIYATAGDMGNFMAAHLQNGEYKGRRILSEAAAKLMQEQHYTNNPNLPGMAYSFIQSYKNSQLGIKHEGADASGFTTTLFLLPKQHLGFFVTINTVNGLPVTFENEFLNRYFPAKAPAFPAPAADFKSRAHEYTGTYRSYDDIAISTIAKMLCIFPGDGEMNISDHGDGTLALKGVSMDQKTFHTRLVEVKPMLFQREDSGEYIAFKRDKTGKVTYAFDDEPVKSYEKLKWYETGSFNIVLLGVCLAVFTATCLLWGIGWVRRALKRKPSDGKLPKAARLIAGLACFLNVSCMAGFLLMTASLGYEIALGLPIQGYFELSGLIAASVLTTVSLLFCIISWKKRFWSLASRIHYAFVVLSGMAFVWFLHFWNILGFRLQ